MNWLVLSLLSALFISIATIVEKKVLFVEHAMEYAAVVSTIVAVLSLPFFLFIDYSTLNFPIIVLLYCVSLLAAVATFAITRSMRHMEISIAGPLMVMSPALTSILAFIVLEERIAPLQVLGIAVLIIGAYFLELKPGSKMLDPVRTFKQNPIMQLLFLGLFIFAITSIFDRIVLHNYGMDPLTYLAFINVFIAINFVVMMIIYHDGISGIKHGFKTAGWPLVLVGALTVAHRYFQAAAVQIAFVGIVLAIKRTSSIFSSFVGGAIFHEDNLLRKSLAGLVMIAGAILIAINF
jgi:drug/metabolite transporter (DMT)-like permease